MVFLVAAIGMVLAGAPAGTTDLKVVVPGIHAYEGVAAGASDVLTDLLLEALMTRHGIRALGHSDARAMLDAEQQKQLLGCKDESCMAELAGALGADWLIAGTLGKLEDLYVINLQIIDARKARATARASATLKSLRDAPAELGRLVDELLGAPPRKHTPVTLAKPPDPDRAVMKPGPFCDALRDYLSRLAEEPYTQELVEERRALLEDLALSRFMRHFDHKRGCFWQHESRTANKIVSTIHRAENDAQARAVRRRLSELLQLKEQIHLLEEAYPRALEMEKMGTGRRLGGLPFEVEPAPVEEPEDTQAVRSLRRAYAEATDVLAAALQAVREDDQEAFLALFTPKTDENRHRSEPEKVFDRLREQRAQGHRFELCPLGIRSAASVEVMARRLEKSGVLIGLWRILRDGGGVGVQETWLVERQDGWRIDRW